MAADIDELPEGWIAHDSGDRPVPFDSRPEILVQLPDGTRWNAGRCQGGVVDLLVGWDNVIAYKPEPESETAFRARLLEGGGDAG